MSTCNSCGSNGCGSHAHLLQLGINSGKADFVIALAGNPNTGKSTVFNALTGLRQHTGNWPGKTVSRAEGRFERSGKRYKLIDLPGTYSLLSTSTDEEIARDFILFGQPDCTIIVVDATSLERNLNLTLQIMEITDRVVVCVNMMDEARRKGIGVNVARLSNDLGVPVVATVARKSEGLMDLMDAVAGVASREVATSPYRAEFDGAMQSAINQLVPMIEKAYPNLPSARWVAMRLLDGDETVRRALLENKLMEPVVAPPLPPGEQMLVPLAEAAA